MTGQPHLIQLWSKTTTANYAMGKAWVPLVVIMGAKSFRTARKSMLGAVYKKKCKWRGSICPCRHYIMV